MIINWLLAVVLVAGIAVIAVTFAEWLKDNKEILCQLTYKRKWKF